jgi:hypothetical protein
MTEKRMPVAERQLETIAADQPSSRSRWITSRIPGPATGRESALTRSGEPDSEDDDDARTTDKLDAATIVAVDGPADDALPNERIV